MGDEETVDAMFARVEKTTGRWKCLVKEAKKIAKKHKNHDHGGVEEILKKCGVPPEDMDYYMKALMECRLGRSW